MSASKPSLNGGRAARRSYGSGRVYVRTDTGGRETFYGSWWANGRRMNRRLGVKRARGSSDGLTTTHAEAELRRLIGESKPSAVVGVRDMGVGEVAARYVADAERTGRKPSTCANIESETRVHLAPFFAGKSIDVLRV